MTLHKMIDCNDEYLSKTKSGRQPLLKQKELIEKYYVEVLSLSCSKFQIIRYPYNLTEFGKHFFFN